MSIVVERDSSVDGFSLAASIATEQGFGGEGMVTGSSMLRGERDGREGWGGGGGRYTAPVLQ